MWYHLDPPGGDPVLHDSGSVHWSVVPTEKPLLLGHYRPVLLENLHEYAQGLQDEFGIDHGPPGHVVHVDRALAVEEGEHHLLGP